MMCYKISLLVVFLGLFGPPKLSKLVNNKDFEWKIDSIAPNVILYFEEGSYADKNQKTVRDSIKHHLKSTKAFIGIDSYDKPIHYFILEDRQRMKKLVGWETNGTATQHYVTALLSDRVSTAYMNHELFHLLAVNEWGRPKEQWINEGMAVYSDRWFNGYPIDELSKFLVDRGHYIAVDRMAKRLGKHNSLITYPLLGSFIKYIDETYGRETVKIIWKRDRKTMKALTGKSLEEYEEEWLKALESVAYGDIGYTRRFGL